MSAVLDQTSLDPDDIEDLESEDSLGDDPELTDAAPDSAAAPAPGGEAVTGDRARSARDIPEEPADAATEGDIAELVSEVRIKLTFDVGETDISLGSLLTLCAGYTFELSTPIETPVAIKACGQVIGRGQLLQIGERIGVRITEINGHATA